MKVAVPMSEASRWLLFIVFMGPQLSSTDIPDTIYSDYSGVFGSWDYQ